MTESPSLEALQSLHRELVAVLDHRYETVHLLEDALREHTEQFQKLLDKNPRSKQSRDAVQSGKLSFFGEEYSINKQFQDEVLQLADWLELDEVETARLLLEAQDDVAALGRSLVECGIIRFHQQRKYLLACMRLCIDLSDDEDLEPTLQAAFADYTSVNVFCIPPPGAQHPTSRRRIVQRCWESMQEIRIWLQKVSERVTAASVLGQTDAQDQQGMEAMEFSRLSLIQQHEGLALILGAAVEKRHAQPQDFENFLGVLKKWDKYDHLLVHHVYVLGICVRVFGSTEGIGDLQQAKQLNDKICKQSDEDSWQMPSMHAAQIAWWIAEYSGFYADDQTGTALSDAELEAGDQQRTRQFLEALKNGAFDVMLSVATDVKALEWMDPSQLGVQQWLQRKAPSLLVDSPAFSEPFQKRLMEQIEVFADAFISNLPDVLRKLRIEEDEQRQLSQTHEQDVNLERFLLIIAYAYDGRAEAAEAFWTDPDSNLAGFMHWASRRASTPLVSAFCEMLQAICGNEMCATAAHHFLLDEGHQSTGKMRRAQSLTWGQIFKELEFFTKKIQERQNTPQAQIYRAGKPTSDQAEAEPESEMMLACYLRLIAKIAVQSKEARQWLLENQDHTVVFMLLQLAGLNITARLRACAFHALRALITKKSTSQGDTMWTVLDAWMTGNLSTIQSSQRAPASNAVASPGTPGYFQRLIEDMGRGFEQPNAFIQLLITLVEPAEGHSKLNDSLPFPESLGSATRLPGIEPYVDFVFDVFSQNSREVQDATQLRILRLSCLEFALICLDTFNENLIAIGNETSIAVDAVMQTTDLVTYVRLHPFAQVMEWMYNSNVVESIFSTIHQDSVDIGSAAPDSPLILSIIRAVEVIIKVLELQVTYQDLIRPLLRSSKTKIRPGSSITTFSSFEEGILNHLDLLVDLGRCCGLGHPALTLVCLRLLEKISTSSKIITGWNAQPGQTAHRNKAIVALDNYGEGESIAASFVAELTTPLDLGREDASPNYMIKIYILDFLQACLRASPDQPTIAHLLLGFKCGIADLSIQVEGTFDGRTSLFHNLIRILLEAPFGDDEQGMRHWLIMLKYKSMQVLQLLWSSPSSSAIVLDELRANDFLFHILLREVSIQPALPWDGQVIAGPEFLLSDASMAFIAFLALRAMMFEYVSIELCSVTQNREPHLKRRIFDALNGRVLGEGNEPINVPTVFDLYDFVSVDQEWDIPPPQFNYFMDIDLRTCVEEDADGNIMYNLDMAREVIQLKRAESGNGQLVVRDDPNEMTPVDKEEMLLTDYLLFTNRQKQLATNRLKALRFWTNLVMVMVESNEFKGAAKVSFLLQALQAILPSLDSYGSDNAVEAFELAKLAKILLFKFDASAAAEEDKDTFTMSSLVSDKLFQLFQICLLAIGKWTGNPELRAVYYSICYRYLTGIVDEGHGFVSGRQKTIKSLHHYGERLLNVICDDAYGGDESCQTAALVLLGALVNLGKHVDEDGGQMVELLNRLNFIGVLVDSLKNIMQEEFEQLQAGGSTPAQRHYQDAKLALLLQLCQSREGAKHVLAANLFRSIELSGLFSADPELQIDPSNKTALAQHYGLLVKVARIIGVAILSRGSHNVLQGRRFLTTHRMLIMQVLKRSAGIGTSVETRALDECVAELAEAFMILITATDFLEFEDSTPAPQQKQASVLFH